MTASILEGECYSWERFTTRGNCPKWGSPRKIHLAGGRSSLSMSFKVLPWPCHPWWGFLQLSFVQFFENCETQPPAFIGWVALSSLVRRLSSSSVPHCNISSYLAQIKKIQKTKCIYFLILIQGGPPHPVNWSPSHSTGPKTPFLTDISVTVAQIKKFQKTKCIFFWILI